MPVPAGSTDINPSPAQVHALVPQRPAFTTTSKPSTEEVQGLINLAVDAIQAESVEDFPDELTGKVRYVVALNVASMIETTYFPEQQIGPDAPAELLYRRYIDELGGLRGLLKGLIVAGPESRAYSVPLASSPVVRDIPRGYWDLYNGSEYVW